MKPERQFPSVSPFHQLILAELLAFSAEPLLRWLVKMPDAASWHSSSRRPAKPSLRSRVICSLIHPSGFTSPIGSQVKTGAIACAAFSRRLCKSAFAPSDRVAEDAGGRPAANNHGGRMELHEAANSNLIESRQSIRNSFAMPIHVYCNATPPRRGHWLANPRRHLTEREKKKKGVRGGGNIFLVERPPEPATKAR